MPAQSKPYPAVQLLIDTVSDWIKHRRELNELRQLDRAEFDRIADDLRVAPADLEQLVRSGPHGSDELHALLLQLGIGEKQLASTQPLLLRDMERVCGLCRHKAQCDRELSAGTAAEHYDGYCPNASTLAAVQRHDCTPA